MYIIENPPLLAENVGMKNTQGSMCYIPPDVCIVIMAVIELGKDFFFLDQILL